MLYYDQGTNFEKDKSLSLPIPISYLHALLSA